MAVQTFTTAAVNSSDAYFRDWGKKLSDALTAVGLFKTADTGQVDWDTVSRPTLANQMMGYEIRAFQDTLQASNPVIFRIEYGGGDASAYTQIMITVCRATDGAGNVVGESTRRLAMKNASSSTTAYNCFVSGDVDRVSVAMFANSGLLLPFYIERTKNASGGNTTTGVNIVWSAVSKNYQVFFPRKGLQHPLTQIEYSICCLFPGTGTTASYAGDIGLFPIMPMLGYTENPDLGACVYFTGDIAFNTDVALTILGSSHVYKTIAGSIGTVNGNGNGKSLAMRYE